MDDKSKKPLYKNIYFWIFIILAILLILAAITDNDILGYLVMAVGGIAFIFYMHWFDKYKFKPKKKKNGQMTKPLMKRWWAWLIVVILVIGGLGNTLGMGSDDDDDSNNDTSTQVSHKKKNYSQNLPGQKINTSIATKHEFYWTDKSNKKVRYFVDYDKKITAIKVAYGDNPKSTPACQNDLVKILNDKNLKYTSAKKNADDVYLKPTGQQYLVYSPAHNKWYSVSFVLSNTKDLASYMIIYPGKIKNTKNTGTSTSTSTKTTKPKVPSEYKNALITAQEYNEDQPMSKAGLLNQLTSSDGEGSHKQPVNTL